MSLVLYQEKCQHPDGHVEAPEETGDAQLHPRTAEALTALIYCAVESFLFLARSHIRFNAICGLTGVLVGRPVVGHRRTHHLTLSVNFGSRAPISLTIPAPAVCRLRAPRGTDGINMANAAVALPHAFS